MNDKEIKKSAKIKINATDAIQKIFSKKSDEYRWLNRLVSGKKSNAHVQSRRVGRGA